MPLHFGSLDFYIMFVGSGFNNVGFENGKYPDAHLYVATSSKGFGLATLVIVVIDVEIVAIGVVVVIAVDSGGILCVLVLLLLVFVVFIAFKPVLIVVAVIAVFVAVIIDVVVDGGCIINADATGGGCGCR